MTATTDRLRPQPLSPLRSDFEFSFHDSATLDRLKQATLEILENTGVRVESPGALEVLGDHGARVDRRTGRVRLSPDLVLSALSTAPRDFVLGSRDGSIDLDLASGQSYCTTHGCASEVVDYVTGLRRPSTKADVADVTRMQDYLGSIGFWWPTVGAGDCGETAQLHELDAGWRNTVKHLQGMVQGARQARHAVRMAEVIAGSREALRRRPVLSDLIGTVSPLVLDRDGMEAALVFAEAGVPVCFVSMPMLGTTTLATRAGAYALAMAEVASATALLQLAYPGAPVLGSLMLSFADPWTGALMAAPLDYRCQFLGTELVHHFGLPSLFGCGGTDSDTADTWQAAAEAAHTVMLSACDGCELLAAFGLSKSYNLFTPEAFLLGDDVYQRARYAFLEIPFDTESFGLEVIDAVGPGGHFLGHQHTRRHMPAAIARSLAQEIGPDKRYRDAIEAARERALDILRHYEPEPLDEDRRKELAEILKAADDE
ncbi:MAG TPA: trimethylamine methyltransferase family protein [Thermoleophilia bacterium]|nr:trimethylamine methyltransferase family protein [Thermoleophilia bacterium]